MSREAIPPTRQQKEIERRETTGIHVRGEGGSKKLETGVLGRAVGQARLPTSAWPYISESIKNHSPRSAISIARFNAGFSNGLPMQPANPSDLQQATCG